MTVTTPGAADADVAPTALLLSDPARVAMLWAVSDGRALPAGELAAVARVRPSTASEHLAKLVRGGLLGVERNGRHRYYRLANDSIMAALEALAVASQPAIARSPREAHIARKLRLARSCYDHIAGTLGVGLADAMITQGCLQLTGHDYHLTDAGRAQLRRIGLDPDTLALGAGKGRRPFARACLDWSERRYHLAGSLGAALLSRLLELAWLERVPSGRALRVTALGRRSLRQEFDLLVDVEVR